MSLKAIIWAWDQKVESAVTKLILLKLADNTNDETGACHPKISTIAKHCECHRRTVERNLKKLEKMGLIVTLNQYRENRQINNSYRLNLAPAESRTAPAESPIRPGTKSHRESVSITTKSIIKEKSIKKKKFDFAKKPGWLSDQLLTDFVEHRKQLKKPLTQIGLERLFLKLGEIRKQGMDPNEAINNSILSGYQGVFANQSNNKKTQVTQDDFNNKNYSQGATNLDDMPDFIKDAFTQ